MACNANTYENQSVSARTMPSPNLYEYKQVVARSPAQMQELDWAGRKLEHDLQMQDEEGAILEAAAARRKRARQEASWDRAAERRALREEEKRATAKIKTEAAVHAENGDDTEDDAMSPAADEEPDSKVGRACANQVMAGVAPVVARQAIQSREAVVQEVLQAAEEQSGRGLAPFAVAAEILEARSAAIGAGLGLCLCKGVCECVQVHSSAEEDGSPSSTMTRLAVRAGGLVGNDAPPAMEEATAREATGAQRSGGAVWEACIDLKGLL
jgi:hypothetical protein